MYCFIECCLSSGIINIIFHCFFLIRLTIVECPLVFTTFFKHSVKPPLQNLQSFELLFEFSICCLSVLFWQYAYFAFIDSCLAAIYHRIKSSLIMHFIDSSPNRNNFSYHINILWINVFIE